ncbi:hypothetical protein SteCoe_25284 [Stentor coeruleus]|uniref:Uncharacterized protein n=1 Tax=Stentor coeruleus TaxID=5963 RepID=A0A1R2BFQ1_9CILI|nr:hypothetical protein SteCoe_25284 [Stentor coeruleus]
MAEPVDKDRILDELKSIKQTLSPVMSLLQDFKELKIRNRLSPESNVSVLNLLCTNIKDDIIKEVNVLNTVSKKSISDLENSMNNEFKEVYMKFEGFQTNLLNIDGLITQLNDNITSMRGHLNNFYDKLDKFRKELDEKAQTDDMNDIRQKCKLFAMKQDFDELRLDVYDKAELNFVDKIDKRVINLESRMKNFIEINIIDDIKTELRNQSEAYIDLNCLLKNDFGSFKDSYVSARQKAEEDFKNLVHKIDTSKKNLKDSITEVSTRLAKCPWKRDIDKLDYAISLCAKSAQLKNHEETIIPMIEKFTDQVNECIRDVGKFEIIVRRYDEILLEKASKDDIKFLKERLPFYVTIEKFRDEGNRVEEKFRWSQGEIESLHMGIKNLDGITLGLTARCDYLKKEQKDISGLICLIEDIQETLKIKADKIDFHKLIDITTSKESYDRLLSKVEIIQKQIELNSILNLTLCRTLINNGELSSSLIKKRQDLYKKFGGLVSWIKGELPHFKSTTPFRATPTPTLKAELYLYKEDSAKMLNKTASNSRNNTSSIKMRSKRYMAKLESASLDLKDGSVIDALNIRAM